MKQLKIGDIVKVDEDTYILESADEADETNYLYLRALDRYE